MREVTIKIKGANRVKPILVVDGNQINVKENNFANYESKIQTENNKIEVCLYRYLEIRGRLWWLMSLVFFFVSLFGIFDCFREKRCIVLDCKFIFDLTSSDSNNIDIGVNIPKESGRAVEITTEYKFEEVSNCFYVDKVAKKRLKIMKWIKAIIIVVSIVALILLIRKF